MARPERHDADYFPFYCKNGNTFSLLRARFGTLGIGLFTELLIILTTTPKHHVQLETPLKREIFAARLGTDNKTFNEFIEVLYLTEKINIELWKDVSVLVVPDHLDSIVEAYSRRVNSIVTIKELRDKYHIKGNGTEGIKQTNTPPTWDDPEPTPGPEKPKGKKQRETTPPALEIAPIPIEEYSKDFEEWWIAYPKKIGKGGAYKAWKKHKRKMPSLSDHIGSVKKWAASDKWGEDSGKYIPNPQTWINESRWDDTIPAATGSANYKHGGSVNFEL